MSVLLYVPYVHRSRHKFLQEEFLQEEFLQSCQFVQGYQKQNCSGRDDNVFPVMFCFFACPVKSFIFAKASFIYSIL